MGRRRQHGFTLIELSIVLVILGLLVGSILAGVALMRASALRAVSTESTRYTTAIDAFRDKYFAIPGDFKDATRVWGRMNGNADCVTNSGTAINATTGVCDGDGDGNLSAPAAASQSGESYQFWRQLYMAGLIEGPFTGLSGPGSADNAIPGTNVPQSKIDNAGWSQTYLTTFGDADMYSLSYGGNLLEYGAAVTNARTYGKALKPEEAWNIDTKIDDGKPATGRVIARYWNNLCATPDDGATFANTNLASSYKLADPLMQCALYFRKGF